MAIQKGVALGPYEILAQIGAGGMGEVWRARDKRIGRDVAVKVLPESYTHGQDELWRFEQEARAAGGLNHPGLVTIFDVGTTDGSPYIVMELLEGETLRDVIDKAMSAPLPLRKVIDYATQIASALAIAHEKGIIHRDLKPENLFLTTEGRVKILDFGLAKLAADAAEAGATGKSVRRTSAGIVVGTPGYMSPEQARGHALDHRTDIFSLGSVLYELLSGRPAFDCLSAIETMQAVLSTEPPSLVSLVPAIPSALDAIVCHCMEKNPRERFQSARDLAFQLRMLPETQGSNLTEPRQTQARNGRQPRRRTIIVAAAALLLTLAAAGGFTLLRGRGGEAPDSPRVFRKLTSGDGLESFPSLAPDGKSFAFVSLLSGNRDIYVQRVDGRAAINITSDSPADDSEPAFSPDGSQIAFRSEREGGGIFVMGVTGESARRLTDFGHHPSWSPDSKRIVFSTAAIDMRPQARPANGELWMVDTRTEAKRPLVQARVGGPDFGRDSDAVQPSWSPNGKRVAFWALSDWVGQRDIWTIDPDAREPKRTVVRVTSDPAMHWNPVWSPDGRWLYYGSDRDGTLNLWRIPMDETSGKPVGPAEPLSLPAPMAGNFTISQQGDLAYQTVTRAYRLVAVPFDALTGTTGPPRTLFGGSEEIMSFEPSPDGKSIAFTAGGPQEDLFIANIDGTRVRQLTNDAAKDRSATWSPDGKALYVYSNRDGAYHIWSVRSDGGGLTSVTSHTDLTRHGGKNIFTPAASPDGRTLVVQTDRSAALVHLDRPLNERLEPVPYGLESPRWSPDGTRLAGTVINSSAGSLHQRAKAAQNAGIGVYWLTQRRPEQLVNYGQGAQWLPDGRIVFFESDKVGLLDPRTRVVTMVPFAPIPGLQFDTADILPTLSADGQTLYFRQTLEQGDIWLVRPGRR
ncbi:MAG TPA: protein kinase [Thermoanaerobaculia bacterium]|nr:protein kinase [Thermoanaerobaculia bacterium]